VVAGYVALTTSYSLALKPDVSAPGVDIVSPIPGGYGTWSGTSMATPAVSGAAALLRQRHPTWTPAQIKSALVLTGRPVFNDTAHKHPTSVLAQGGGMIDVQAADAPGLLDEAHDLWVGHVAVLLAVVDKQRHLDPLDEVDRRGFPPPVRLLVDPAADPHLGIDAEFRA